MLQLPNEKVHEAESLIMISIQDLNFKFPLSCLLYPQTQKFLSQNY